MENVAFAASFLEGVAFQCASLTTFCIEAFIKCSGFLGHQLLLRSNMFKTLAPAEHFALIHSFYCTCPYLLRSHLCPSSNDAVDPANNRHVCVVCYCYQGVVRKNRYGSKFV